MTPRKQCLPGTAGLKHIKTYRDCVSRHKACTGSCQIRSEHCGGEENKRSYFNQKLFAVESSWQRENPFYLVQCPRYINHTPGQALTSGGDSQHIINSMIFVFLVVAVCGLFVSFCFVF